MSEPASSEAPRQQPTRHPARRRRGVRAVGLAAIIAGAVFSVTGAVAYAGAQQKLSEQRIVVSEDASMLAGHTVDGPFTALAQAMVIAEDAEGIAGGRTYAELPQDDPRRDTVLTASFLQASLFTSVLAFGVSALVFVLGIVVALIGWALRRLDPAPS